MKELEWGETPWDNMSHEQLSREVQRMFSVLESAKSVLGILKVQTGEGSPFWGKQGSGGRALDRASQVIAPVYEEYDQESVYKAFFRYAPSLLFNVPDEEKWVICPECGEMWSGKNAMRYIGTACADHPVLQSGGCKGMFRLLEWDDLAKKDDSE